MLRHGSTILPCYVLLSVYTDRCAQWICSALGSCRPCRRSRTAVWTWCCARSATNRTRGRDPWSAARPWLETITWTSGFSPRRTDVRQHLGRGNANVAAVRPDALPPPTGSRNRRRVCYGHARGGASARWFAAERARQRGRNSGDDVHNRRPSGRTGRRWDDVGVRETSGAATKIITTPCTLQVCIMMMTSIGSRLLRRRCSRHLVTAVFPWFSSPVFSLIAYHPVRTDRV